MNENVLLREVLGAVELLNFGGKRIAKRIFGKFTTCCMKRRYDDQ